MNAQIFATVAMLIGGAFVPVFFSDQPYVLQTLTLALAMIIPAVGLNLVFGYTGLISLGHMGFAGVGGYTAALLMKQAGFSAFPALLGAALAAGLVGLLAGLPCLRLRSHFFIIVTLGLGLILSALFNNLDWLTGGAQGLPGIPRPTSLELGPMAISFRGIAGFYRLALIVAGLVLLLQWLIVRSPFGRSLLAIRQDEAMAAARGVNVFAHKLAVFALSAAIAGVGGGVTVMQLRVAAPSSFDLDASINLVAVVIIGGAGTLIGPVLGAMLFVALPEVLRAGSESRLLMFGALLVLIALYAPKGLVGMFSAGARRFARREKNVVPA
jgi:ABC-type branched-subunit amino acid transport system permease subunit